MDISNIEVQKLVFERAVSKAHNIGCDVLYLDSFRYTKDVPRLYYRTKWPLDVLANLRVARTLKASLRSKLVTNLGDDPRDWEPLIRFVDGLSYEYVCRPEMYKDATVLEAYLAAFKNTIAHRKATFLWWGMG